MKVYQKLPGGTTNLQGFILYERQVALIEVLIAKLKIVSVHTPVLM